jgi:hypothetical protein
MFFPSIPARENRWNGQDKPLFTMSKSRGCYVLFKEQKQNIVSVEGFVKGIQGRGGGPFD